jgi:hypothetical protein
MNRFVFGLTGVAVALILLPVIRPSSLHARAESGAGRYGGGRPVLTVLDQDYHDVSKVYLVVTNRGTIGLDQVTYNGTGFFPSNTANNYVFGTGLWFGARYDADDDGEDDKVFTIAYNPMAGDSEFREGTNDQDRNDPLARIFDSTDPEDHEEWPDRFRAEDPETGEFAPRVISDQDLVTTYTTKDRDPLIGAFQIPLEVDHRSMAFKRGLAGQAIFLMFDIVNWGDEVLLDSWIGYGSDMDVGVAFSDDLASFIRDRLTTGGDSVRVNMGYAWDSDFVEPNFTGDPGFVGITYLRSPGNPSDGIDNDGDGIVDESPFNSFDDDGDGQVDEADEVDELGLVNYSKFCGPSAACEVVDPQTDPDGYDLMSCISEFNPDSSSGTVCLESTTPADIRFMVSSGPFDWYPGERHQVVFAMVFANPTGDRNLPYIGDPPRPDPNDDDLVELLAVKETVQRLFDLDFRPAEPPVPPHLSLVPGDRQVSIFWDDLSLRTPDPVYEAFVEIDSTYREYDFQGYRVWRSRTADFSRLGDPEDPDWPLTPEAVQQNSDVAGLDLALLAQYDLADGITTESHGTTCYDSIIQVDSSVVYTDCDTFNLGSDTGLRYSYVDRGDPDASLTNGFRYFYAVTAYDYNSDDLPMSRLSLDSGVSFSNENSAVPRSHASSFIDAFARIDHIDSIGTILDDTSSIFLDPGTGELDSLEAVHASNALVDFTFTAGIPQEVSDDYYALLLDDFERTDDITNRIGYHLEDAAGSRVNIGSTSSFEFSYDGTDRILNVALFDSEDSSRVVFTADLTFNVDTAAIVLPDPNEHFLAENAMGEDIADSLGMITIPRSNLIEAGFRGADLEMIWIEVDEGGDSLTLMVRDLDNRVEVPFGEGIVSETFQTFDSEKGSNWSFLPIGGGTIQPGGRYFLTDAPLNLTDLWLCGVRMTLMSMDRMPLPGDVWTLRQVMMTTEVDTTITPPETSYVEARRPPVPGTRYRLDTQSGGPEAGEIDLGEIRVVPNPYLANASWDIGPTQRRLEFIHLPPECTIRIYTISGNLVRTLQHTADEGGTEVYDLLTHEGRSLASGNYYYHVTTRDGRTHLGRFALVQ